MARKFLADDRDSEDLLPRISKDCVPEDSLASFISEAVNQLDLTNIETCYGDQGRNAYPPRRLLALWIYAYATGVNTARPLAEKCRYDLRYRFLCGGLTPQRDTLLRFRKRCEGYWDEWFQEILKQAAEKNLVDLACVCLDGTKIKANASLQQTKTLRWMETQESQLQRALEMQETFLADGADDEEFEVIQQRLEEALDRLRSAKRTVVRKMVEGDLVSHDVEVSDVVNDQAKGNLTDPDSGVMKTAKQSFQQSYNGQISVDPSSHLVMTKHVSQAANDKREIEPTLEAIEQLPESLGKAEAIVADAGYYSEENLERCEQAEVTPFVAPARKLPDKIPQRRRKRKAAVQRNAQRLTDADGRLVYAQRASSVETVFGIFRNVMKFNEFRLRGLKGVNTEWTMLCMAWNLKRMYNLCKSSASR